MSITISQSPTGYPSAHGEVWHVVESTNKVVAGFQYVFDIYKSGNLVTRVKNSPYGTGKYGVLDVGNIVRASLESGNVVDNLDAFAFDATEQMGSDQFWTEYDVRYGEVSGGVTSANIASGTYRVYNNYSRNVWDRKGSDLSGAMILSNRPTDSYWYAGEPVVLSVFLPSGQTYARQEKYNGSVQNEYTHTGNGNAFVFGWTPASDEITFQLSGSVSGVIGTRNIKKKCAKYDTYTLVFLNAFGAFDSYTFIHGKLLNENQKKRFEQMRWSLSGGQMVEKVGYAYNEASKVYAGSYKEKMQLTSDILSTGEYDWLSELINSPLVYLLNSTTQDFYPVIITDSNYEFKDERINKTDTLTVNIEFSVGNNVQFR
jgi:hypothetical protein